MPGNDNGGLPPAGTRTTALLSIAARAAPWTLPLVAWLASPPAAVNVVMWGIFVAYAVVQSSCYACHRICAVRRDYAMTKTVEAVEEERRRPRVLRAAALLDRRPSAPYEDDQC